jgi:hypothetical protein
MRDVRHGILLCLGGDCGVGWSNFGQKGGVMKEHLACNFCRSVNQRKFVGDMSLRAPGLENIGKLPVVLSPQVYVCLDCCTAEFIVPEVELRLLVQRDATATDGLELLFVRRDAAVTLS